MVVEVEPQHLFTLEDCSNLSELTLEMEHSESNAVQDSISILSTLDPARSGRLVKIVLEANYVSRWFNEDGQPDRGENWEGLDSVLSKLANASTSTERKGLTFILVVMEWCETKELMSELMSTVRKWLPELLPRFNELGLLHVHYVRGGPCRAVDGCLPRDKPGCLGEDVEDNYSEGGFSDDST